MKDNWRKILVRTAIIIGVIYALEYGASLFVGRPFSGVSTSSLVLAIVVGNFSLLRKKKTADTPHQTAEKL